MDFSKISDPELRVQYETEYKDLVSQFEKEKLDAVNKTFSAFGIKEAASLKEHEKSLEGAKSLYEKEKQTFSEQLSAKDAEIKGLYGSIKRGKLEAAFKKPENPSLVLGYNVFMSEVVEKAEEKDGEFYINGKDLKTFVSENAAYKGLFEVPQTTPSPVGTDTRKPENDAFSIEKAKTMPLNERIDYIDKYVKTLGLSQIAEIEEKRKILMQTK